MVIYVRLCLAVFVLCLFIAPYLHTFSHAVSLLPGVGAPNAVCLFNGSLYLFGFENLSGYPRVYAVVVDALSGAIVKVFVGSFGGFYDCAVYGGRVYAVGAVNVSRSSTSWLITVFGDGLNCSGNVSISLSRGVDVAMDIAVLGNSLYVAGVINRTGFSWIRIERRALDTLSLEAVYSIPIGLGKRAVPRIAMLRNSIVLGYTLNDVTHIIFLSNDLKPLDSMELGYGWHLLSIAADDNCIYLGTTEGIAKVCNGIVKAFHYANGGSAISVKMFNNSITALILIPNATSTAIAELRILDKDLELLHREVLDRNAKYQLYIKPLEIVNNRIFIAIAERGWVLKSIDISPQLAQHKETALSISIEIITAVVYTATIIIAITLYTISEKELNRSSKTCLSPHSKV